MADTNDSALPCPAYVLTKSGKRRYCEQGEENHWGTCCGDRSEDEYNRLVAAAHQATS